MMEVLIGVVNVRNLFIILRMVLLISDRLGHFFVKNVKLPELAILKMRRDSNGTYLKIKLQNGYEPKKTKRM
jgi:hypothetical protein